MTHKKRYKPVLPHAIDDMVQFEFVAMPIRVIARSEDGIMFFIGMNQVGYSHARLSPVDVDGLAVTEVFNNEIGKTACFHQQIAFDSGKKRTFHFRSSRRAELSYRVTLVPVLDDNGNATRLVATIESVTLEYEAISQRAAIESKMVELEHYLSLAAHDLRTPMRQVENLAHLIKEDVSLLTDEPLETVVMLEKVAARTQKLIVNVLEHASITTKSTTIPQSEFDFQALCLSLHSVLDPFENNQLIIEPCCLIADRVAMQMIMGNLIDNAMKHSEQSSIRIHISVKKTAEDGFIEISVEDNGAGFADPESVFLTPFDGREHSGFGLLGLRKMVLSQGGGVELLTASSGKGALVKFTFPGSIYSYNG